MGAVRLFLERGGGVALRDTLLSKLISGELRLKNAKRLFPLMHEARYFGYQSSTRPGALGLCATSV
ncbi:MAG: hypothetical protein O7I42_16275 [Alphaproteobacteria bacterium]|nr:hypothetical protein [Alphaproteobacteria bacterium]